MKKESQADTAASGPAPDQKKITSLLKRFSTLIGLFLISAILALTSEHFLSAENFLNILLQNANIAILAVGMTMVIILGEIDLSVGGIEALGCVVAAWMMVYGGLGIIPSIVIALIAGTLCGMISGFFVAYFRFHSFVSTLAMMGISRGLALIYTHGASIYGLPDSFRFIGQGSIGPIAVPVIIAAVVLLLGHLFLTQFRMGNHIYAVGGNIEAARLAGINVGRVKMVVLSISGFCSALAGVIMASRLNSGQGTIGEADLLDTIAAVIIGGTSLMGGVGTIPGTILGVLIIGVIRNGLNLLGVSSFWQMVAIGVIIICAVLVDEIRRRLQEKER
jgi:ribose/xylose/arabinose/galactoside ABC-type transport system permease subunit